MEFNGASSPLTDPTRCMKRTESYSSSIHCISPPVPQPSIRFDFRLSNSNTPPLPANYPPQSWDLAPSSYLRNRGTKDFACESSPFNFHSASISHRRQSSWGIWDLGFVECKTFEAGCQCLRPAPRTCALGTVLDFW